MSLLEEVHWCVKDNILAGSLLLLRSHSLSASTKGPSEDKTTVLLMHKQFYYFVLLVESLCRPEIMTWDPYTHLKPRNNRLLLISQLKQQTEDVCL